MIECVHQMDGNCYSVVCVWGGMKLIRHMQCTTMFCDGF